MGFLPDLDLADERVDGGAEGRGEKDDAVAAGEVVPDGAAGRPVGAAFDHAVPVGEDAADSPRVDGGKERSAACLVERGHGGVREAGFEAQVAEGVFGLQFG